MAFGYLTLFTALIISLSAAVYSILGLTAIFAAAFWPIVIMGGSLEFGKIVTTLWLHKYWNRAEIQYKVYLCSAVAILMLLTSMGVFGFLSKAHTDQNLVSGDVQSKIAIYDEKIKTARENIDANRKQLKQMDEAVDQVMARSTTEGGADKSNAIRRSQAKDRSALAKDIEANQKLISQLNDQAAPIRAEVRKVEAEVGPIKYIAAMIYGDNPDANILEKSVRWVIILIVIVFDPLALTLLLAATKTFEWERGIDIFAPKKKDEEEYERDDGELTPEQLEQIRSRAKKDLPTGNIISEESLFPAGDIPVFEREEIPLEEPVVVNKKKTVLSGLDSMWSRAKNLVKKDSEAEHAELAEPVVEEVVVEPVVEVVSPNAPGLDASDERPGDYIKTTETTLDNLEHLDTPEKIAIHVWKEENPDKTLKRQRHLFETGAIRELPWNTAEFRAKINTGFGVDFPSSPTKGDMFIRTDRMPSELYKFVGTGWIHLDKEASDSYAYNEAYIDYLIEKLATGEYDADLLSDAERSSIEHRLNHNT